MSSSINKIDELEKLKKIEALKLINDNEELKKLLGDANEKVKS